MQDVSAIKIVYIHVMHWKLESFQFPVHNMYIYNFYVIINSFWQHIIRTQKSTKRIRMLAKDKKEISY